MTETATVDTSSVEEVSSDTDETVEPVITDELVRSIALELNPWVKLGESPAVNTAPNGWLADVVTRCGSWDEALAKFPEAGRFLHRLRGTLERIVAGA